ncbi:hypothetical protein LXL04_039112 [Taraxacum kok-saghyz]
MVILLEKLFLPIQPTQPVPLAKVHLLTDAYAKPIPVIAFFDTGSSVSLIDPNILLARFWKPHYQTFYAANGQMFAINKISIPINIRLFPRCVIRHRFLGCNTVAKDMLIGFDLVLKLPDMRFHPTGLRYKSFFNPYSPVQRVCMATPNSSRKNPSPLWLNPDFFVELPFKQNEDVNPTKASHPGMNPDHYQLAVQECDDLVEQGVIESTTSPWACEAFYVNKRNKQTRGKLRLVINYQPLNHFLADDKFPLPQKKSLFQSLVNAKVMSKFDLKSGFWQLGSNPKTDQRRRSVSLTTISNANKMELVHFPDELRSQKEIQQFLGVVNYMSDFLPKLSTHTVWLFPMLKKNPPTWSKRQTEVVREIKKLADVMPPLKIPSTTDKRILQTDASDDYWGAVLLVEDSSSVRSICGYISGTFKVSEQHYHSTFKEILAVKRGIKKFQFHLIGHEFLIEMDMASFPRMLQFKQKMLPEAQLLRWANWFSQWKFTVKYIKGTDNVLADFLSRPRDYKSKVTPSTSFKPIKMVHLIELGSSSSSTKPPLSRSTFPTVEEHIANLPNNIKEAIADMTLPKRATLSYKLFLTILLQKHGDFMKGLRFHPNYPFLNVFHIHDLFRLPKEALVFFWYLFEAHTIAISFNASKLVEYVFHCEFNKPTAQSKPSGPSRSLFTFLEWFLHGHTWAHQVDPATIPREIMHELTSWSDKDPVSFHWIQALEEWRRTHLQPRIDTSDDEIDSYTESGYLPDMDETHFDQYEDSRWK